MSIAEPTSVALNNGLMMPKLAFAANVWPAPVCRNATSLALDAGFRFMWSSFLIGAACQRAQRTAIDEHPSITRAGIFLAGTVDTQSCASKAACYSATLAGATDQFSFLGPEPLDMLMLDYPSSGGCDGIAGQWQAFTELYRAKKVKSIAVSNFGGDQLACLFPSGAATTVVPPVANQLSFYVGHTAIDLALNARHGIVVQAYSPLDSGSLASDPLLEKVGKAHSKTAAQVALRYIVQKNVTIATQSTKATHLSEDLAVFGWTLTPAEMVKLDAHRTMRGDETSILRGDEYT
mmetsp:Transcript_54302/g.90103  ORF Transcript_54302/g.90103 Transcript_54302/m.90103 type:complete len:292 (+) Transcript_54302:17-892(+)